MAKNKREFDIVLYGATGFTGGLVAEYLARTAPDSISWAIAGRSKSKLEAIKTRLGKDIGIIIANTNEPTSLSKMAARAQVVITTVGPYVDYGEPLVAACVSEATHYLDITGEPEFVSNMLRDYDKAARDAGVYIINCCGFDSIPADLGAYYTAQQLPANEEKAVRGFVAVTGRPSGGTWVSAIKAMSAGSSNGGITHIAGDAGKLSAISESFHHNSELDVYAMPMPVIDPSIVERSSRTRKEYGNNFQYAQYFTQPTLLAAGMAVGGVALVFLGAQLAITRNLLLGFIKQGEGPSEQERRDASFELTFIGESESGKSVITKVSGGDPGYDETSKMISECALTIAEQGDQLKQPGGVTTPAGALGNLLLERLQNNGIQFRTVKH